jgi:mono/diheme cytochrome c family protein
MPRPAIMRHDATAICDRTPPGQRGRRCAAQIGTTRTRPRRLVVLLVVLAVVGVIGLGGCAGPRWRAFGPPAHRAGPHHGGMQSGPRGWGHGPGMMGGYGRRGPGYGYGPGGAMLRQRGAMQNGIPPAYADARNPLPASAEVIAAGAALYQAHCATCHGSRGAGDGPGAAGLSPPPADLRWTVHRPMATDGYLMWAISEGGAALGTGMPAFAGALSERERWRIIRYLRTL